jgi:hypothetical protein
MRPPKRTLAIKKQETQELQERPTERTRALADVLNNQQIDDIQYTSYTYCLER